MSSFKKILGLMTVGVSLLAASGANAQIDMAQKPVLVITNKPMAVPTAPMVQNTPAVYASPSRAPEITPEQVAGAAFYQQGSTAVAGIVDGLNKELLALQTTVARLSEQLRAIENRGKMNAAAYYASIATINTQLQTGTTPGNPRLVEKLDAAQYNLDSLVKNVADLNALGVEISQALSKGNFLLQSTRNSYNLAGAIEEDHARLAMIEDQASTSIVGIERLLNNTNDDISRTTSYLSTERNNLRTLALAVTNGDLYGNNLSNSPFARATQSTLYQQASYSPQAPMAAAGHTYAPAPGGPIPIPGGAVTPMTAVPAMAPIAQPAKPVGPMPLAKIRFDKPNVNYEQPVYNAVQNALSKYPAAKFELVAVHPSAGNSAQVAIESTRARRNAERVLRTLTQMGVDMSQVKMSYNGAPEARSSEVHLYVR